MLWRGWRSWGLGLCLGTAGLCAAAVPESAGEMEAWVAREALEAVASCRGVWEAPPDVLPTRKVPDGPLLGNGDLGVAIGAVHERLRYFGLGEEGGARVTRRTNAPTTCPEVHRFHLSKNDFWKTKTIYPNAHPAPIGGIDEVFVVSNAKFAGHFSQWSEAYRQASQHPFRFSVINDGSTDDSNKLGAIGDLNLVLEQEKLDDDLIVVAGDNLFNQSLRGFGDYCRSQSGPVLGVYDVGSLEQARKYGVVDIDATGRITSFVEKPTEPASTLIGIALYYYPRQYLASVRQYIAEGNNPDQPGRLIQWLYPRTSVMTWSVPGIWYDIGSKETLAEANRIFARR